MNISLAVVVMVLAGVLTGCAGLQPVAPGDTPSREEVQMMQTMQEMRQGFTPDGL